MSETTANDATQAAEASRDSSQSDRSPAAARARDASRDEPRREGRDGFVERVLVRLGLRGREDARADLEDLLGAGAEAQGLTPQGISPQERAMLRNVLRFHRTRVYDVMVPRADIVAVAQDTSIGEMLRVFRTAGHSRLPVYGETLDDPKGMIHIRDFLDYFVARAEAGGSKRRRPKALDAVSLGAIDLSVSIQSAKLLRAVLFVPPSMPAVDLLVRMQSTRTHMALVIDEYGGTDGLVSIEDLVEMVVGDIEDEHDLEAESMVRATGPDTYVADARADLEEVSTVVGYDFSKVEVADDVDTLGGLVVAIAGRVPARAELILGPGSFEFEVLDADPRRLKRVRIHRRDPSVALAPGPVAGNGRRPPAAVDPREAGAPAPQAAEGASEAPPRGPEEPAPPPPPSSPPAP